MFAAPMLEAANGRVSISDLDSKGLEFMLKWMYAAPAGAELDDIPTARGLLQAAAMYQLDDLKVCSKYSNLVYLLSQYLIIYCYFNFFLALAFYCYLLNNI
jgi:hypothetical protein